MDEENLDYERYYVEMFVDRDTFVQFIGGGIGHWTTQDATHSLQQDVEEGFSIGNSSTDMDDSKTDNQDQESASNNSSEDSSEDEDLSGEDNREDEEISEEESDDEQDDDELLDDSLGYAVFQFIMRNVIVNS
ncbi:hypothetical protein J132_08049 [Termitomyces sp. J132]|nr:hypothetical protein J132_08049 [Termitomyces sp. J132]